MVHIDISSNNKKRERIRINNINDFKDILKRENYNLNEANEEDFKMKVAEIFEVNVSIIEKIYKYLNKTDIMYRAKDARDFIDYIEKMTLFEDENKKISEKLSGIKKLIIDRIEYERERIPQYIGEDIISDIEEVRKDISRMTIEEEKIQLEPLEKEIENEYLYTKDIELLKKMIISGSENVEEKYNHNTKIKTITIVLPKEVNSKYIPAKKGSIEYHEHLNANIPRIKRLIKNMNKYMEKVGDEEGTFKIYQSKVLQDSINIAVVIFNNVELKAISGSNEINNYYKATLTEETFKSHQVNKLGKLGVGYNRTHDSEKKIFEEIHKQIISKKLKNEGSLILYSKWEPCPSCCFVISQFGRKYPNIKVKVKYSKKYGE